MSDRRKPFPFDVFEPSWQARWDQEKTFRTPGPGDAGFDPSKPKYYVLDMFPYPSGSGLHVGHPEGYTATDILARTRRMQGYNVLHPMGWDAFGLPAEQYAIKTGQHPRVTTEANVANFRRQLKSLGFSYDWDREVDTTAPDYVRWTQWIFLRLYHSYCEPESGRARPVAELEARGWTKEQIDAVRLAYVAEVPVNWSPDLGTVLANEEVEEWRAKGHQVERRPLRQWMLRITAFADRLMEELDGLDWPEGIKTHQRNWIGKSEGAEVEFPVPALGRPLVVFTTRPDTLFGATYMVLAPEHPWVDELVTPDQRAAVDAYRRACSAKSDLERTELAKEKTGVFTGAMAVNPVNGKEIPIWIADYVLMGYGTGAIMAVPAHDERDHAFARQFSLPIVAVVEAGRDHDIQAAAFTGDGLAINSSFLDGLGTEAAKARMLDWLEAEGVGRRRVNFKLRDWLFSRQRYWGEPFPIVWENGGHRPIDESELPLLPPAMEDFKPTGDPRGPLARATEWIRYSESAERETNTMPQWAGSCWYYLRFCDPGNTRAFISKEAEAYWLAGNHGAVDLYVGGTEHAVLHLLYARFWHKVLHDLGYLSTPEPFQRLVNQGLILGEDGQKMSKSRGNVINPDEVVAEFGADSLRLFEMFMGPLPDAKPWSTKGVEGVHRFLARVWRVVMEENQEGEWQLSGRLADAPCGDKKLRKVVHETIRKVGEDIDRLAFNTAISQMMVCNNAFMASDAVPIGELLMFLRLLNPFAPHVTEELNARLQAAFPALPAGQLCQQAWPAWDPAALVADELEIIVQINGKLRDKLSVAPDCPQAELEARALQAPKAKPHLEGLTIRKVIVVPGKLVNIVAN